MPKSNSIVRRFRARLEAWENQQRIQRLAQQVAGHARPDGSLPPVVFFNASARITGLSQNAAFQQLAAWSLRLGGAPVIHFVSRAGMNPCVLGTNRQDFTTPPPCQPCLSQSARLYQGANVRWFSLEVDPALQAALQDLNMAELAAFEWPFACSPEAGPAAPIPLGRLVLPAARWALRRHTLEDNAPNRYLLRAYITSAFSVARQFAALLVETRPLAAVIFNGIMYPEATAHWVAVQMGVRAITHEVGFQRFSTFFTTGQATAYPMQIPDDFQLSPEQDARLDAYLEKRFQGKFTMAGIRFWPEMRGLDQAFLDRLATFRQLVPVFTNVVYDTSQVHANVVFPHMFAWLDQILELVRSHPETLFVIRAHPDEMRPGTAKQSNESVRDWVHRLGVDQLPNVVFIDSQEYISSYELIQRAKFVIVYNSSIGLESALLGAAVLCGGKARYTQYPTVFSPETPEAYRAQAEAFLSAGLEAGEGQVPPIPIPPEFQRNARRFMYYQLYRASLPLEAYLEAGPRPGFVQLRPFTWEQLRPESSPALQVIFNGIVHGSPFLLEA